MRIEPCEHRGITAVSVLARARIVRAQRLIREGKHMSQAMEANAFTTPVALRMLRVGSRTGRMGDMMERIAVFHDEEIARWLEWFTKTFEPLLMALLARLDPPPIRLALYFPLMGGWREWATAS